MTPWFVWGFVNPCVLEVHAEMIGGWVCFKIALRTKRSGAREGR